MEMQAISPTTGASDASISQPGDTMLEELRVQPAGADVAEVSNDGGHANNRQVRRSRTGRIITPATRNAVANSIGKENVSMRPLKRAREDDIMGAAHRRLGRNV